MTYNSNLTNNESTQTTPSLHGNYAPSTTLHSTTSP